MRKFICGIDIGSTTTEIVVLDTDKHLVHADRMLTAGNVRDVSRTILDKCKRAMQIEESQIEQIVATGYGRKFVHFATANITEISCYAKGAAFLNPDVRTVIDIGGQDSKVISVNSQGAVNDFVMNDKCAAGTGRFLEMIAKIFDIELMQLGVLSLQSSTKVPISSICAVFAESEAISLIAEGHKKEDIINSVHHSMAGKVFGMASRLSIEDKIMFCGGVAANTGMLKAVKELFKVEDVYIPENVEIVGALGAALFGFNV